MKVLIAKITLICLGVRLKDANKLGTMGIDGTVKF